jgi:hypothetical protein
LLGAEIENEGIKAEVQKLQTEVTGILADLAKLGVGKKEDIDPKKLEDISVRLTEIPIDLNKKKEAMAKTNKSFADASTLFVKALNAANKAITKEMEVKGKLAAEAAKGKEAEEKAGQSTIRLPKNITRAAVGSKEDETVGKVQQLIIDKFGKNKDVNSVELFQKFLKFGADKRFGGTTAGVIVALKSAFGLEDSSPDITQELLDELTKVKVEESESFILDFNKFSAVLEDFNLDAFKKAATGANPAAKSELKTSDVNKAVANKDGGKEELSKEQAAKIEDLVNKKFDEEKKARVKEKLIEREQFWLNFFQPIYNKRKIADSCYGVKRSEESRQKMSISQRGAKQSAETIAKRSAALKGRPRPAEVRAKISASHIGIVPNDETRAKMSESAKRRKRK